MFENLSERLNGTLQKIRGQRLLTENNIREALREVRIALLEADVALPVVKDFVAGIRAQAIGQQVHSGVEPGQAFIKLVHRELVRVMGEQVAPLDLRARPPVVVLVAGLQGAGKTTAVAKLAYYLRERENKRVLVASCDVHRPAAMEQLERLAGQAGVAYFAGEGKGGPEDIARRARRHAGQQVFDVLLIDTAGRLHVDQPMMEEARAIHRAVAPHETLFVVDAMTGQDAANTARAFNEALALTGVVLTKADGDARGGAALSVRSITGQPIKFIGVGEKIDAMEPFHPDRLASRILGMGDVLSLVEEVERKVDRRQADHLARKVQSGRKFNLDDFRQQLLQMENLGGIGALMDKLPGMGQLPDPVRQQAAAGGDSRRMIAIINAMTPQERRFPDVIRGSRKRRIALGSGTRIQDVNRVLKQYQQMQKMMRKLGGGRLPKMMKKMQGRMPGGGQAPW